MRIRLACSAAIGSGSIQSSRSKIIVVAALGLLASLVVLAWPRDAKQPLLHLVVVRRVTENGKPIVVFRVKVSDGRRIQITGATRIVNGETEAQNRLDPTWGGLWTLSHGSPLGNPATGRNEFYVCEPTNSTVWQMRVYVSFEEPNFLKRVSYMPNMYRVMRKTLKEPALRATKVAWNTFYSVGQRQLDSDFITNTVAVR
jgi:hypothetical protein